MNNKEYEIRRNPLIEQMWEGRYAYEERKDNPYDYNTEFEKYISWEVGYTQEYNDQILVDMGR